MFDDIPSHLPTLGDEKLSTLMPANYNKESKRSSTVYGDFKQNGDYFLNPKEVTLIHHHFLNLSQNRTEHVLNHRKKSRSPKVMNSHRPEINKISQELTNHVKVKLDDKGVEYEEYLMMQGKEY